MPTTDFEISEKTYTVSTDGCPEFKYGDDVVFANESTDISFSQPWYQKGYAAIPF